MIIDAFQKYSTDKHYWAASMKVDEKSKESCAMFTDALAFFRRQSWDEAKEKFHRLSEISATDGPAHFYRKLCDEFKKTSPGETWDGVVALEEKKPSTFVYTPVSKSLRLRNESLRRLTESLHGPERGNELAGR